MKAAILHLSDIHIDGDRHPILRRAERISRSLAGTRYALEHIIIVVSGDIAHSGTAKQYQLAHQFLQHLESALISDFDGAKVSFVLVPGNHDCDLTKASDVREPEIIESKIATLDLDGELTKQFLAVQRDFFDFASQLEREPINNSRLQLCRVREIDCSGTDFRFYCLNTAWLTQNPERPSRLYFPTKLMEGLPHPAPRSVAVSVFHHPYNWLNPNNAQQFKQAVEEISDLMLSGHEHSPDVYSKRRGPEELVHCLEADALWEPTARTSAYNLLLFDLEHRRYSVSSFRWSEGTYLPRSIREWGPFDQNQAARPGAIENSVRFKKTLDDLGAGFSHRYSLRNLTLSDLFVYPELVKRLYSTTGS